LDLSRDRGFTPLERLPVRATEAVTEFLATHSHAGPDLLARWNPGLETQVNVLSGGAQAVPGRRNTWTDGKETWHGFRMPKNADSEPSFKDYTLGFDLAKRVLAIGSTGWNWRERASYYLGFDFDAISGHAEGIGISDSALAAVREAAQALPYVELRRSTGGAGWHLYILLEPFPTANHTEHAALARAALGLISQAVGFDFLKNVDACGGNMWLWHRKATPENRGFELVKAATETLPRSAIPTNWQLHSDVVTRRRAKVRLSGMNDVEAAQLDSMSDARLRVTINDTHKRTIAALEKTGFSTIWCPDHHLLQTHTCALAKIYDPKIHAGDFKTLSSGDNPGEPNCFAYLRYDGGFDVYRFKTAREADTWDTTGPAAHCVFNGVIDLGGAARMAGAAELPNDGGWQFPNAEACRRALAAMGIADAIPEALALRAVTARPQKDGRTLLEIQRFATDAPVTGWAAAPRMFQKVCGESTRGTEQPTGEIDNTVRVVVNDSRRSEGIYLRSADGTWAAHSAGDVIRAIRASQGLPLAEAERFLGLATHNPWQRVSMPFKPEFPGGRQWNQDAAQLAYTPAAIGSDLAHPYWDLLFNSLGRGIDEAVAGLEWARKAGIHDGGDYLRAWTAAILRDPFEPSPILFFHGQQGTGKSAYHQSLSILAIGAVEIVDRLIDGRDQFNGQLERAIFCVLEEQDFSKSSKAAAQLKEYSTATYLTIRRMRTDAYQSRAHLHFIQCANSLYHCAQLDGDDTRTTIIPTFRPERDIPRAQFQDHLRKEAPAFLRTLFDLELPELTERFRIPAVNTESKQQVIRAGNGIEDFVHAECIDDPAGWIAFGEFYDRFIETLSLVDAANWSKTRVSRSIPSRYTVQKVGGNKTVLKGLKWKS
jgi:hypothetical protein